MRIVAVLAALASCTPNLPRSRDWISGQLVARTGSTLRAQTNREFAVPSRVKLDDGLTSDEAIAIAIWNNPAFQADLTQLGVARGDLADAGVLPNPIVTLLFPIGTKQLELTVRQGLGALWQRPSRVAAARSDAARIAEQLVQRGLDLARDVELAMARVTLAEESLALAGEASTIWDRIGEIADARQRVGEASAIEARSIHADAAAAHAAVGQAETELSLAQGALRNLLGAPASFSLKLAPRTQTVAGDVGSWVTRALAQRADLRAARHAIDAAGERAGLERRQILGLTGIFDLNGSPLETGPGIELAMPIFDQRQGGRIRARAEIERASWAYVGLRLQIAQEVGDAHARLVRANAQVAVWRDTIVPERVEARRLAQEAFAQGEESFLVVLETTRALVDARRRLAESSAEEARAAAEIERASGGKHAP